MENLVYTCVFANQEYILLLKLLLQSLKPFKNKTYDVLVLTHPSFESEILSIAKKENVNIFVHTLNFTSSVEAKAARLDIFDLPFMYRYKKILYLDTDILINGDLNDIFSIKLDDKLYVVKEGYIECQYWGGKLFDFENNPNIDRKTPGFSSGIMLFNKCDTIKCLFKTIHDHLFKYHKQNNLIGYVDQQFINYHTILQNLHNTELLSPICTNSPGHVLNFYILHFAGSHGTVLNKYNVMQDYLKRIKQLDRIPT